MIFSQFLCTKLPKNKKRSILQETCCSRSLRNSITTDSVANFSGDNRLFDRSVHYRLLIPTSHITHTSWILFGRAEGKFTKILQNFPRMPDFSKRFPHIAQQGEYWQRHLATIFQTAQTRGTIEALLYSAWTMNVGLDTYMSCASFPFTAESTAEFRNKCSVRNKGSAWFQIGIPWCNPTTKPESGGAFFFCCAFLWFQGKQTVRHSYCSAAPQWTSAYGQTCDPFTGHAWCRRRTLHRGRLAQVFAVDVDEWGLEVDKNLCEDHDFFSRSHSKLHIYVVSLTSHSAWHFTKIVLSINRVCLVRP